MKSPTSPVTSTNSSHLSIRAPTAVAVDALRMVGEIARHVLDRVRRDEGAAALVLHIRPIDDGEQRLLAAVEEMAEEAAVLVPAAGLGRRLHPRLVGAAAEVDDEGIRPLGGIDGGEVLRLDLHDASVDAILAAGDVAERPPGLGRDLLDRRDIVPVHPDDVLGPGGAVVGVVAEAGIGLVGPLLREVARDAALHPHIALLDKMLRLLGSEHLELLSH